MATTAIAVSKTKRKRVVLSIENRLKIIDLLDQYSAFLITVICEKYGIGKSTVGDIKKNRVHRVSWWIWYHFFFPVLTLASWGVKSSS